MKLTSVKTIPYKQSVAVYFRRSLLENNNLDEMFSKIILPLLLLTTTTFSLDFTYDCTSARGPCLHYCFTAFCRGFTSNYTFHYDNNPSNYPRRQQFSGCSQNPCSYVYYNRTGGDTCDEFPFASTTEGGSGARLRCVDRDEKQGGFFGSWGRGGVRADRKQTKIHSSMNSIRTFPTKRGS
jgi:hypothetical protein